MSHPAGTTPPENVAIPVYLRRADKRAAEKILRRIVERQAEADAAPDPDVTPKLSDAVEAELAELRAGPTWKRLEFFLRDEKGERIRLAEIHRSWIEFVERAHAAGLHAGFLAPFEHGKTAIVLGLLLDEIGRNRNLRAQVICNNQPNAVARVSSLKAYIESSEPYRLLYPDARPGEKWQVEAITVARDSLDINPTARAYGITSGGTSSRSDLSWLDDVDDLESLSADIRNTRRQHVENVWLQRAGRGRVIATCTAWHEEDFAHVSVSNPGWAWLIQGVSTRNDRIRGARMFGGKPDAHAPEAVPTEAGGQPKSILDRMILEHGCPELSWPTWDERWPKAALDAAEKLAPRAHARGRRQEAYSEAEKWFPSFKPLCVVYGVDWRSLPWRSWRFVTGVDPGGSKRPGNAIVTAGRDRAGVKWITDARFGAWTSPDTMLEIAKVDGIFRPDVIEFESVSMQRAILEWTRFTRGGQTGAAALLENIPDTELVRPDWWTRVHGYETKGDIHMNELVGIRALEAEFAAVGWVLLIPHAQGEVVVDRGKDPGCGCGPCELLRQVDQHPHGAAKDGLMALWFTREGFATWIEAGASTVRTTAGAAMVSGQLGSSSWSDGLAGPI